MEDWNNLPDDTKSARKTINIQVPETECFRNGWVGGLEDKLQVINMRMSPPPTSAVQFKNKNFVACLLITRLTNAMYADFNGGGG